MKISILKLTKFKSHTQKFNLGVSHTHPKIDLKISEKHFSTKLSNSTDQKKGFSPESWSIMHHWSVVFAQSFMCTDSHEMKVNYKQHFSPHQR